MLVNGRCSQPEHHIQKSAFLRQNLEQHGNIRNSVGWKVLILTDGDN